jgi:acetyl-CoA acetyltransferase
VVSGRTAIIGLGITDMTRRRYDVTALDLAAEAVKLALEDCQLPKSKIDGLLVNGNMMSSEVRNNLQDALGLADLTFLNTMSAGGATAGSMVQYASFAIEAGLASVVALVFADAPLRRETSVANSRYGVPVGPAPGLEGLGRTYGDRGQAAIRYALAASRHMHLFGTTSEQLGAIAVAQRQWASLSPLAQKREPITLEDHQSSRMIAEPFRLLDCCLTSNGAVAVIMTSADTAKDGPHPPVFVRGVGQGHPGEPGRPGRDHGVHTGAVAAGRQALQQAEIGLEDVDVLQIYDSFTYTVLVTLEDYGFCPKGEGGPFVADGRLAVGGSLPCNTGGGQLSGYYAWGFTPLSEGIIQARGTAGERQVAHCDHVMVSGSGGFLNHHSTVILSPLEGSGRAVAHHA